MKALFGRAFFSSGVCIFFSPELRHGGGIAQQLLERRYHNPKQDQAGDRLGNKSQAVYRNRIDNCRFYTFDVLAPEDVARNHVPDVADEAAGYQGHRGDHGKIRFYRFFAAERPLHFFVKKPGQPDAAEGQNVLDEDLGGTQNIGLAQNDLQNAPEQAARHAGKHAPAQGEENNRQHFYRNFHAVGGRYNEVQYHGDCRKEGNFQNHT